MARRALRPGKSPDSSDAPLVIRAKDEPLFIADPNIRAQFLNAVRLGQPKHAACSLVGIHQSSFWSWRKRGLKDIQDGADTEYSAFVNDLHKAEAEAEARRLLQIDKAAQGGQLSTRTIVEKDAQGKVIKETVITDTVAGDWKASAYLLEKVFPERYGTKVRIEHDWRLATARQGIDPDELKQRVTGVLADWLTSGGAGGGDSGVLGGAESVDDGQPLPEIREIPRITGEVRGGDPGSELVGGAGEDRPVGSKE